MRLRREKDGKLKLKVEPSLLLLSEAETKTEEGKQRRTQKQGMKRARRVLGGILGGGELEMVERLDFDGGKIVGCQRLVNGDDSGSGGGGKN